MPYRVHALDFAAGELDGPVYSRLSYFHQVPLIDDDGFIVGESWAVLLYIAERAGKLIPADLKARTQVVQWCFAALAPVGQPLFEIQMIDIGVRGEGARARPAWQRMLSLCAERQGVNVAVYSLRGHRRLLAVGGGFFAAHHVGNDD